MAINFKGFDSTASGVTGSLVYKGSYNATTATPDLTTATKGDFYIVSVAGTLAGVTLNVGDHIVFNQNASSPVTSSMFDVIDNTDAVSSVNAQTGVVVLDTDDISETATNQYFTSARFDTQLATKSTSDLAEGSNLYYTDARADTRIGAADLTDLSDVNYTAGAPIDGYVLKYVNANSRWEAQAEGGASVGTLQQVTDQGSTTTTDISTAQITLGGDLLADSNLARTIGSETNKFITAHSDLNGAIRFKAKASEALSKGDVIYIDGVSGGVPTVSKAQANSASTMPAFGLAYASASLNAEVQIVTLGNLDGINTGSLSVGDTLYVSSTTAGALTNTAPTGEANLIQNIAKVVKVDAVGASGIYKVGGAGRTNATPNLNTDKVFLGNASNQATPTALSSINLSSLNNDLTTTDISEGTNLYYTNARFDTQLATKSTSDLSEGTNLYYTDARADARIAAADLTDLSDVNYTAGAPIDGYVLKYVNANSRWEAQAESGGGSAPTVRNLSPSSNYTISTHAGIEEIYILTPSADISVFLPSASSCGSGYKYNIKNMSTNTITIDPNGTETIDGAGNTTFDLNVQYQSVTLVTDGSNWFII